MRPLRDYARAFQYFLNYLLLEKPKGLDFSLRDLSVIQNEQQHGYAMTSDAAVENIASIVPFSNKRLLDVGSGKGRVPYKAFLLGCSIADGVEFSKKLHQIATKNYETLKVTNNCKSHNVAAEDFNAYNNYDIFFLFNPFEDDLYERVIDRIMSQVERDGSKYLICYGGANLKAVHKYKNVIQVYRGICPHRNNRIAIFQF